MIYLIAHLNSAGTGVACAEIKADSEPDAREEFRKLYPEREISVISTKDS